MTDNEIIKALSCCITVNKCEECPYKHLKSTTYDCLDKSTADAIELICLQHTELESWKRLYEDTCTELKEMLVLEREIREEAIKDFIKEVKNYAIPYTIAGIDYKVITETVMVKVAERMGVNK